MKKIELWNNSSTFIHIKKGTLLKSGYGLGQAAWFFFLESGSFKKEQNGLWETDQGVPVVVFITNKKHYKACVNSIFQEDVLFEPREA